MAETTYDRAHFHTYDELTALLRDWERRYPGLLTVESIGISYEGRNIWATTLTNQTGRPASEKPALYVDGNMHAGEVTGCAVAL